MKTPTQATSLVSNENEFRNTEVQAIEGFASTRVANLLTQGKLKFYHFHEAFLTVFPQSYCGPDSMAQAATRCSWKRERVKELFPYHPHAEASHWRWIIKDLQKLQVDQTARPQQGLLWDHRERDEDADLDCCIGLRPGGDRPQADGDQILDARFSTDSEPHAFRENAHLTGIRKYRLPRTGNLQSRTVTSIRLEAGY
jgi:hypothetical protein